MTDSATSAGALFWRAIAAFLALPGMVAYVVPWLLRPIGAAADPAGIALLAAGSMLLLRCVRDFYVAGRGTLAPWEPPKHLVTIGLYRVSRNPMYVSVVVVLCGWALTFHSRTLAMYAALVTLAFHFRILLFEEPWLARTHGDEWLAYRARVRRWIGCR
jgi:protein-S-isoprenylcysteine O-methyltransferase Ste14